MPIVGTAEDVRAKNYQRIKNRQLSDKELLAAEKRSKTLLNRVRKLFGGEEQFTPAELERLQKLHAAESEAKTSQEANATTNKVEQSSVQETKGSAKGKSIFLENNGQN